MTVEKLVTDVLSDVISGEWGGEPKGEDDVFIVRGANFTNFGKLDSSKEIVMRHLLPVKALAKRMYPGDIIIERSGGSPKQPVGRVVYFDIEDNAHLYLCSNFNSVLRPNSSINPKFLFYFFYYQYNRKEVLKYQNQTTGIINLRLENYLNSLQVKVPSLNEQKQIVDLLDKAQYLIDRQKEAIEKMDELLKSLFWDMFGDPLTNPRKFKTTHIKEMGDVVTGNTPPRKVKEYYGSFLEWIKSDNINTPYHFLTKAEEYLSKEGAEKGRVVPKDSILVTCIAGSKDCIGNAALSDRTVAFNQQINAIVPNKNLNPYFLYTQILIGKRLIQLASTDSMKGIVSKGKFEQIMLMNPPLELQEEFASLFKLIENQKRNMVNNCEKLEENFQSLLSQSFSN